MRLSLNTDAVYGRTSMQVCMQLVNARSEHPSHTRGLYSLSAAAPAQAGRHKCGSRAHVQLPDDRDTIGARKTRDDSAADTVQSGKLCPSVLSIRNIGMREASRGSIT
jgi:hypothetical protein